MARGRRGNNAVFLVVNIVVSLAVALGAVSLFLASQPKEDTRTRPTIVLVVSATPNPNQPLSADELQGTLDAQSLTLVALQQSATELALQSTQAIAALPTAAPANAQAPAPQPPTPDAALPTLNPSLIPPLPTVSAGGAVASTGAEPTPEDGCQRYVVQAGDTASTIAARQGVALADLFVLNGINDTTVLQIGQVLLIPSPACKPEPTPSPTPSPRPTFNLTLPAAPTATLIAVPEDAQVRLVQILNFGDITAETVELQNTGGEINLQGWTLADGQGNIFTFPSVRLVPGTVLRVATRVGTNTPGFLYWNQTAALWSRGEIATLSNAQGEVQSILTVGGQAIDFGATPTP